MDVEIRRITYAEMDDSTDLSGFAFQYAVPVEERARRRTNTKEECSWGAFVEGKLAAKLYIHPLSVYLGSRWIQMGGIASVATWPEYRRQGLVARLIKHALNVMRESGQTLSMLAPFSFGFYRKYGWELSVSRAAYELNTDKLRLGGTVSGKMRALENPEHDWKRLNEVYRAYASSFNGMIDRDEEWWRSRVIASKKGRFSVWYNDSGEPQGYVFYHVAGGELHVHDMAFANEEARAGLLHFIANHDSMAVKTHMIAPTDDMLPFLAADPKFKQEVKAYFMSRIVDVAAFIARYPFASGAAVSGGQEEETIVLDIADEHAEWNHGRYVLRVDADGCGEAVRIDGEAGRAESIGVPEIRCDIQTLSAMMMSYVRPEQLWKTGKLQGDPQAVMRLERLIPRRTPFLMDYF